MISIRDLIEELKLKQRIRITFKGNEIFLEMKEDGDRIHFLTSVFEGENYIPPSVRNAIKQKVPFMDNFFKAYLTIDEAQFKVLLHHDEPSQTASTDLFSQIDRFSFLAEEWRDFLDRNGKGDLVPVRVK